MSQPRANCAFCGTNEHSLTDGHIWPEWAGKMLVREDTGHHLLIGRFETFTPNVPGPELRAVRRNGNASSRKPRNTCSKCNSGWMSIAETDAKPAVTALMKGERLILDEAAQHRLARFLCIVSARAERSSPMRSLRQSDMDELRAGHVNEHWRVWIGRFVEVDPDDYWLRHIGAHVATSKPEFSGAESCNTQVTTIVAGQLYAHVTYSRLVNHWGAAHQLTRVWPLMGFPIDTALMPAISEADALWLHEALLRDTKSGLAS